MFSFLCVVELFDFLSQDRIHQLETLLAESKTENSKLEGRLDTMMSLYPEFVVNEIIEWAPAMHAKEEEVRRLRREVAVLEAREFGGFQPVCCCSLVKSESSRRDAETIEKLRSDLAAKDARITDLELMTTDETTLRRRKADDRVTAMMWREEDAILQAMEEEDFKRRKADKLLEEKFFAGVL